LESRRREDRGLRNDRMETEDRTRDVTFNL